MATRAPSPDRILNTGLGLWRAHALAAAVELGVFAELARGPRTAAQLRRSLLLDAAAATDFLDALVGLTLLEREGDDANAVYVNTREASHYLDPRSPAYLGELLRPGRQPLWGDAAALTASLRCGSALPQPSAGSNAVSAAATQHDVREHLAALHGEALADGIDWPATHRLLDVGNSVDNSVDNGVDRGTGRLARTLAAVHPQLQCSAVDANAPAWPSADTVTLDLVLRDTPDAERRALITRASAALAEGGRLIVIAHLLDDTRRRSAAALMLSLAQRMAGAPGLTLGFETLAAECLAAGFEHVGALPGVAGASVLIASR